MKTSLACSLLLVAVSAAAETSERRSIELPPTCVASGSSDALPEDERAAARALFERALERLDHLIVTAGCGRRVELSHERNGSVVIVTAGDGHGKSAELTIDITSEMTGVYERLAQQLTVARDLQELDDAPAPPSRSEELADDYRAEPPHASVRTDPIWYAQYGWAKIARTSGSAFVGGIRKLGSRAMYDVSLALGNGELDQTRATKVALRFQYLRFAHPESNSSFYFGGGGGWGATSWQATDDAMDESGQGLQLEVTAGMALNRTGRTRWFIESNLTMPLYEVTGDYMPALMVTGGFGR